MKLVFDRRGANVFDKKTLVPEIYDEIAKQMPRGSTEGHTSLAKTLKTLLDHGWRIQPPGDPTTPEMARQGAPGAVSDKCRAFVGLRGNCSLPANHVGDHMASDLVPFTGGKVDGTSVRCPGCGGIDPDLGFKQEVRGVPQGQGKEPVQVQIGYIFCANETCHTILSVVAMPIAPQRSILQ